MPRLTRSLALAASLAILANCTSQGKPGKPATKADVDKWMTDLSNWGRWGKDDQLGTINLITPEKRKQAAGLVKHGISVSMSRLVDKEKSTDNGAPFEHKMEDAGIWASQFVLDSYHVNYHGFAHTHLDALCHMFHNGKMYNGVERASVTEKGASKLAITGYRNGIFSRAILMDIPALKGVKYLEPGTAIFPEDLEAWEQKAGVKVGPGDIVLIRTGRWTRRAEKGVWDVSKSSAGLYATVAPWLKQRDVAVIGSDAASDVAPSGVEGVTQPIHQIALTTLGLPILDNADFEALAETAAKLKTWEFLFTAAPLAVEGGTGSPMNPIATF